MSIPFSFPKTSALLPQLSSICSEEQRGLGSADLSGHSSTFILISLGEALSPAPAEQEQDRQ